MNIGHITGISVILSEMMLLQKCLGKEFIFQLNFRVYQTCTDANGTFLFGVYVGQWSRR